MGTKLPPKTGTTPNVWPHVYCVQTAVCIRIPLGTEVGLSLGDIVLDGDPAPPRERGTAAPLFSAHVYCGHGRPSQLLLSSCCSIVHQKISSERSKKNKIIITKTVRAIYHKNTQSLTSERATTKPKISLAVYGYFCSSNTDDLLMYT